MFRAHGQPRASLACMQHSGNRHASGPGQPAHLANVGQGRRVLVVLGVRDLARLPHALVGGVVNHGRAPLALVGRVLRVGAGSGKFTSRAHTWLARPCTEVHATYNSPILLAQASLPYRAHRLAGALPLAAAGGVLALGVGHLGGLPVAVLLIIPILGLLGLCTGMRAP